MTKPPGAELQGHSAGAGTMPSPNGEPLELLLRCWTSKAAGAKTVRHRVMINPDWSVDVPHDLDAEKLAQAFGGWLSCLELESKAIPAIRRWLALVLRVAAPPLDRGGAGGSWQVTPSQGCCPQSGFTTPDQAHAHARDLTHLARQFHANVKQLTDLAQAVGDAHGVFQPEALPSDAADQAAEALVHGRRDVIQLWQAGVHPNRVIEIRDELRLTGRLPRSLYLTVAIRTPQMDWMRNTLARLGEGDDTPMVTSGSAVPDSSTDLGLPEWLAWTQAPWDDLDPTARARWLELGVTRQVLLDLAGQGVTPDEVATLAAALERTPDGAARQLLQWLRCGVRPSIRDLIDLHRDGRAPMWFTPSPAALQRVLDELAPGADTPRVPGRRATRPDVDKLQVAFLLAVCGTVADTVAAHRAGRTWRDHPLPEENTA